MKILFLGFKSPNLQAKAGTENTAQGPFELPFLLAQEGKDVHIAIKADSFRSYVRNFFNIRLHLVPTGILGELFTLWCLQPATAHCYGWSYGKYISLATFLSPETTFVWTIDTLPQENILWQRLVLWSAQQGFDIITTPIRQTQYLLLVTFRLSIVYIPNGYTKPILNDIPSQLFKLKNEQYLYTTSNSLEDLMRLGSYYRQIKSRRKIVFAADKNTSYAYLRRKYPFFKPISALYGRSLLSVLRQSLAVIIFNSNTPTDFLLQGMDAKRPIISVNYPLFEEIMATNAIYVAPEDEKEWVKTLRRFQLDRHTEDEKAASAKKRAQIHFEWDKITPQYMQAYLSQSLRPVLLDSVHSRPIIQIQ